MDWWSEYFSFMIDWWSKAWLVYAVVSLYRRYSGWISELPELLLQAVTVVVPCVETCWVLSLATQKSTLRYSIRCGP